MITLIVTSDVLDRANGFLRSTMINIAPGVFVSDLDSGSRQRIWSILSEWWHSDPRGSFTIVYPNSHRPLGIAFEYLGGPRRHIIETDGIYALIKENGHISK